MIEGFIILIVLLLLLLMVIGMQSSCTEVPTVLVLNLKWCPTAQQQRIGLKILGRCSHSGLGYWA